MSARLSNTQNSARDSARLARSTSVPAFSSRGAQLSARYSARKSARQQKSARSNKSLTLQNSARSSLNTTRSASLRVTLGYTERRPDGQKPTEMSFNNAKSYCAGKGTTLAIITSQEQQNNAHGVCGGKKCWIGLTFENGAWKWANGDSLSYSNWNSGEPNGNAREPYGCLWTHDGKWNDWSGNNKARPLCGNGKVIQAVPVVDSINLESDFGALKSVALYPVKRPLDLDFTFSAKAPCFPPHSTVMLKGNMRKRLDELKFGDIVQDSPTTFSVYYHDMAYNHRHLSNQMYVSIKTENGYNITLSTSHMIQIGNGSFIEAEYIEPEKMHLITETGLSKVLSISKEFHSKHYSPYTYSGTIMVDGILASCYAVTSGYEKMDTHARQHAMNRLPRLSHQLGFPMPITRWLSQSSIRRYLSPSNFAEFCIAATQKFWEL